MVRWFVCPTVSMVTTGHATGLEKTLLMEMVLDNVICMNEATSSIYLKKEYGKKGQRNNTIKPNYAGITRKN